jgi:DNA-binding SARP family transcriptional activator/tRNA A-37 threonylcarbamoyl transferase component Bud32/Tfp pilus assembly protein PilF
MLEFRVLGSLDLRGSAGAEILSVLSQPKRVALLTYLAVAKPRGFHRRDKLVAMFWPELDQDRARAALRKSVHHLRRSLGDDAILGRGDEELTLNWDRVRLDAAGFEEAAEGGRPEEALELYRGPLLEGFHLSGCQEFEQWLEAERERLRYAASRVAWTLAHRYLGAGLLADAERMGQRALALAPTDEVEIRRFIEALARAGDRAAAVAFYEKFAEGLGAELELRPDGESRGLVERIRASMELPLPGEESSVDLAQETGSPGAPTGGPEPAATPVPPSDPGTGTGAEEAERGPDFERLRAAVADRYRIEREIGSGGMATVYLAYDLKHDRRVAVKVLNPELGQSLGTQRFLREIKTAAGLTHPHVLPLFDSGEAAGSLFYVMPYVKGESLRARLTREGQLPIEDALRITREIADALAHAHEEGIIHRDVKPANIMLEAGHAVLADFGVAQAVAEAKDDRLTRTGSSLGTPAYMSPEQAAGVRGLDGRTDQYALACVLYEMLSGHPPFAGTEVELVMRRHITDEPPPITEGRPSVPAEVARVIQRALAKSPADRFKTTGEMAAALALTTSPARAAVGFSLRGRPVWQILAGWAVASLVVLGASGTLTDVVGLPGWVPTISGLICLGALPLVLGAALEVHNRVTWRMAGGVVAGAFVLLATGTAGYMGMRVLGIGPAGTLLAAGTLEARDSIVLADFETRTVDPSLAYTVTEGFRVDLSQSPTVKLADKVQVAEVLRLMERDPDALLDFETARELARREGLKAVIGGEIDTVGSTFVLLVRLVAAETGEELHSDRETAANADAIIPAIDRLSGRLRERIGESLKTVRQAPRLSRTRTASLEALKLKTEANSANDRGDWQRCVNLLTDAIALDTLFGSAYYTRGYCYHLGGHHAQEVADYRKAFELREHMTENERAFSMEAYYAAVTGETEKAIEVLEAYLDLHPDYRGALNNLSIDYADLGRYAKAEEVISRLFAHGQIPVGGLGNNLVNYQLSQRKFEEAEETLRRWKEAGPDSWLWFWRRFQLAFLQGDYEAAEGYVTQWRGEYLGGFYQRWTGSFLGRLALTRGKLDQAQSYFSEVVEDSEGARSVLDYRESALETAYTHLYVRNGTALAQETLDAVWVRYPLESVERLDRPYVDFAEAYARAGQPARARALLQELRDSIPRDMWWSSEPGSRVARGWIAVAEGRLDDARVEFRPLGGTREWEFQRAFALGQVYDRMEQPDSAIANYEFFLATPYNERSYWDAVWLPLVLERLGQLYEQEGDPTKAAEDYGRFVDLWADADAELQPRVEAARRALERLRGLTVDSTGSG